MSKELQRRHHNALRVNCDRATSARCVAPGPCQNFICAALLPSAGQPKSQKPAVSLVEEKEEGRDAQNPATLVGMAAATWIDF